MTQFFNGMNPEESISKGIHGDNTPNYQERFPNFVTNSISSLVVILFGVFFREVGEDEAKSLEEIDEGSIWQEKEDDKGTVIKGQSHLAFKDIVVEGDGDEEVGT